MESTTELAIDLFSLSQPTLQDIDRVAEIVNACEANQVAFTNRLEEVRGSAPDLCVGIGLYLIGRYAEAVERLHAAPEGLEKFLYLGRALARCRRYEEAVNILQMALDKGGNKTAIRLERVGVYRMAQDFDAADAELKKVKGENTQADFHYQRARLWEAKGQYDRAIEDYKTSLALEPNHELALFHLALRCDLNGDEDAAIDYYRKIGEKGHVYISALLNLAVLYEDAGQFEKASQCVDAVLVCYPNHERASLFQKDIDSSKTMFFDEEKERRRTRKNQILETPITDFELSVRSRNCLKKMNIRTLGDLLRITEAELLSYKNFGETSLREIKAILDTKGLNLGMALEDKQFARDVQPTESDLDEGILAKPVEDLQLSVRSRKCLVKLNIRTIGDLTRTTDAELLGCKNFGVTSLNEINKGLTGLGLSLRRLD
jgi:DNA-directed RNA polymerase subunit alpha